MAVQTALEGVTSMDQRAWYRQTDGRSQGWRAFVGMGKEKRGRRKINERVLLFYSPRSTYLGREEDSPRRKRERARIAAQRKGVAAQHNEMVPFFFRSPIVTSSLTCSPNVNKAIVSHLAYIKAFSPIDQKPPFLLLIHSLPPHSPPTQVNPPPFQIINPPTHAFRKPFFSTTMSPQDIPPPLNEATATEDTLPPLDDSCACLAAAIADLKDLGADFTDVMPDCGQPACATCAPRRFKTNCPKDAQGLDDEVLSRSVIFSSECAMDEEEREEEARTLDQEIVDFFETPGADLPDLFPEDSGVGELLEMECGEDASQLIDRYIAEYSGERFSDLDELRDLHPEPLFFEQSGALSGELWEMVDVTEQQVGGAEIDEEGSG